MGRSFEDTGKYLCELMGRKWLSVISTTPPVWENRAKLQWVFPFLEKIPSGLIKRRIVLLDKILNEFPFVYLAIGEELPGETQGETQGQTTGLFAFRCVCWYHVGHESCSADSRAGVSASCDPTGKSPGRRVRKGCGLSGVS